MAKLIIDNVEYELLDGSGIAEACREAGIPFNCNTGVCGSCQIKVLEGAENLDDLHSEEIDFGMDKNNRLGCMCVINGGMVKITF
ncbi:MAG: (2Fe-2S)-binding protein [Candidatus Omnitrophica bacterium]|nr:(2Fe-2S)-binding protein [Candidatus Omnitrophota bacterium]MBU1997451.1 (2Fe-2S)-binding protein [Candidatus Omnitrophota bacterium]MBU4334483.1 (2Fe-2S)-binding protein [Candidatus Omnitrophota bacterium]